MRRFLAHLTTTHLISLASLFVGCSPGITRGDAEAAALRGDYETAVELFTELATTSDDPEIYCNRANCYSYMGNLEAALADYETAIGLVNARADGDDSLSPSLYYNRGHAYDRAHKYAMAASDYETTIELNSDYPDVKHNLAWLLATCPDEKVRNPKRALELARQVLQHSSDDPGVLDTVAACYAAAGDFQPAISSQEKAITLCPDPAIEQKLNARLELYRNQQPYLGSE